MSQLTYEGILELFRETQEQMKAQSAETDRKFQDTDRKFQDTDRIIKETAALVKRTNQDVSALGDRIGEIVENMVGGNIIGQFQNYGYNVTGISRNIEFGINGNAPTGEIDVQLDDGDVAILIEVKTKLTIDDVRHHIETMEKYRKCKNDNQKRYIGAVASTVAADNVVKFAQKNGMYVVVQSGYAVEILKPPKGFKAKEW
jgi:hypothetical protein